MHNSDRCYELLEETKKCAWSPGRRKTESTNFPKICLNESLSNFSKHSDSVLT